MARKFPGSMWIYDPRETYAHDPVRGVEETDQGWLPAPARREYIKGIIAAGASASTGFMLGNQIPCSADNPPPGPVERLISLKVNGITRRVDILPGENLAATLRYRLGLTGTKLGCDQRDCGSCTILVGESPIYACTLRTEEVGEREITTIEGLSGTCGNLHPVQQAFADSLSTQCGSCIPGQIMATVALLKANQDPTRAEAQEALAGHICHCEAYEYHLGAALSAAKAMG